MSRDIERRNIICNAIGEGFWGFGMTLGSFVTVLPLLVTELGGSEIEVGLLGAIVTVCLFLPQGLSSLVLQHGRGRKGFLIGWHFYVMIPLWTAIGLSVLLLGADRPVAARVLVLVFVAAFMLSMGFILPVWIDWVAGLVRERRRGTLFGAASSVSAIGGTAAALVAKQVCEWLESPVDYAVLILSGGGLYCLSLSAFFFVREIDTAPPRPRMTPREVLSRFRHSLSEPNFRRYLVARLLLTAGGGPVALLAVHYESAEGGAVAQSVVIGLGALLTVSQAATGFAVGRLGDSVGHKRGAEIGAAAQVGGILVAVLVPGAVSCGVAFACVGTIFACNWVSHQNMLFETCPHDCRTAHITISNLVLAPLIGAAPVMTGWLARLVGTRSAFAVCLVPTVAGLAWLLFAVKEPRVVRAV